MKILEVAGSGAVGVPPMGPVTNDIFQLATEFKRLGHDIAIADVRAIKRDISVPCREIDAPKRGPGKSFEAAKAFVKQLLAQDLQHFDIVHTHDWRMSYLLHREGIRTVYTSHTPNWVGLRGAAKIKDRLRGLVQPHEREVIYESMLTIALGDYFRIPGANIAVVQNGIRADAWTRQSVRNEDFTILFLGRLAPTKGVHVLIEALRLTRFGHRAYVVGSPAGRFEKAGRATQYALQVQNQARGLPVTFTGFIPNTSDEFRRYLSLADVVVVPSLFEPQGNVVLEALAMGVPVIASNVGGIPLMLPKDIGVLVPPGDPIILAEALSELHGSPERRKVMAARARPHVIEHFSWESCARRHVASFERAIKAFD